MALTDYKITTSDYVDTEVADLADQPTQSATELKAWFDKLPKAIAAKINSTIDYLVSTSGADDIGVNVSGILAATVAEALAELLVTKADLASPVFTGAPTLTSSPTSSDDTTKITTCAWVNEAITAAALALGDGGMLATTYDTTGKATDIFGYCTPKLYTATLTVAGWGTGTEAPYSQTVTVSGIGLSSAKLHTPSPDNTDIDAYVGSSVRMSDVTVVGSVTFTAQTVPESELTVYIKEENYDAV